MSHGFHGSVESVVSLPEQLIEHQTRRRRSRGGIAEVVIDGTASWFDSLIDGGRVAHHDAGYEGYSLSYLKPHTSYLPLITYIPDHKSHIPF